jgi:hypothetical protein
MIRRFPRRSGETADRIEELLLRINGLVRVRELLRQRSASEAELESYSAEIGRLQWRLSRLVIETQSAEGASRRERPAS